MSGPTRRVPAIPLPLALALFVVSIVAFTVLAWPVLGPTLLREEVTAATEGQLTVVESLSELTTLSWVRRTVFPHDFYETDTTYNELLLRHEDSLTPEEETHLDAGSLAWDLGLALSRRDRGFVVVTAVVEFGYDLSSLTIEELDGVITIELPTAEIRRITLEDIDRRAYPYGEIPIDADGWREITTFVRERIRQDERIGELSEESRENAIDILQALLSDADEPIEFIR